MGWEGKVDRLAKWSFFVSWFFLWQDCNTRVCMYPSIAVGAAMAADVWSSGELC